MLNSTQNWVKLGKLISPKKESSWMYSHTGPSFAFPTSEDGIFQIFITGRDIKNRSTIGRIKVSFIDDIKILDFHNDEVFKYGELGSFDENGVSYPMIVESSGEFLMYYVGWMPSVLTPFLNFTGLAKSTSLVGNFTRVSRAPILERTNEEPFSTGSAYVIHESKWKMWYTSFSKWGCNPTDFKHYYNIKYAESEDGINWDRKNIVCIDFKNRSEYSICRPSVLKIDSDYHMWYTFRGKEYRIGYAHSNDGIKWNRMDDQISLDVSETGWDSKAISYPHVFQYRNFLYMIYCGNEYGKEGLGVARLSL